jgi:SAM-dependent methyltransferase
MRRLAVKRGPARGVSALRESGRKLVLHVGCGPWGPERLHPRFRGPEWQEVRLDIDPGVEPDIVDSIVGLSNVEGDSVEAIWSAHNIEHVYAHEVLVVLRGFLRVLRPGGEALIATPDLQVIGKYVSAGRLEDSVYVSAAGPIAPLDMLFGLRSSVRDGNEFMAHRTGFSAKTLAAKLRDAGFERVGVERKDFELRAHAHKPL